MTAKRGMLWKTPWGRRKGVSPQTQVPMWFFNLGADSAADFWSYEAPLAAPSFTQGPTTLWCGFACLTSVGGFVPLPGLTIFCGNGLPLGITLDVKSELTSLVDPGDTENELISVAACGSFQSRSMLPGGPFPPVGVLAYDWNTVTVGLVTVVPEAGVSRLTLWIDNVQALSILTPFVYGVPPSVLRLFGTRFPPIYPSVNGVAGGPFALTDVEIQQWFANTRNSLFVEEIPGKTSDWWTATSVAPFAPLNIPNLEPITAFGGQILNRTANGAPTFGPTNVLVPVVFNY